MALVNLKEVLTDAYKNRYAIGSFNVINMEFFEAIIDAAEKKFSPVILSIAEVHFKYVNIENITPAIRDVARRAEIPVVVHLDHGTSFDAIIRALRAGFTSVMFDGSALSLQENINQTKEIIKICHAAGVTVEAELGHIAGTEGEEREKTNFEPENFYTKVDEAIEFVKSTEVDALAIAIGTAHGVYRARPELDFERLRQINEALRIPLVLHGGTGLSSEDFRKTIDNGVAKINFYTGMSAACCDAIRDAIKIKPDSIDFPAIMQQCKTAISRVVEDNMEIFKSANICKVKNSLCSYCFGCRMKPEPGVQHGATTVCDENIIRQITEAATSEILKHLKR